MSNLTPAQIGRLRKARRWFWIEILAAAVVIIGGIALMIVTDYEIWAAAGAVVGGFLIRVAFQLWSQHAVNAGLNALGAKAALDADRDRRTGRDQLTKRERARRATVQANIMTGLGVLSGALLIAAVVVFFQHAGRTAEEGAPLDLWIPISLGTGVAALIATPLLLSRAKQLRPR
ncbi:hypothetical protein [Dactylosporangium sp. NPDC005555]|uniref:hypothetical protein n=1 Tax=Dactylosporangium sp. NPDC005555 TaxID=3154889 RepID=UPI0033B73F11